MARRVFTVADPRCGRSTALSQASNPGRICGFARTHQATREGLALAERPGQGRLVDDRATRGIDQHGRGFHQGQGEPAGAADQACPIPPKPTMPAVLRPVGSRADNGVTSNSTTGMARKPTLHMRLLCN